jgi:amidophosphoribosyltransferase
MSGFFGTISTQDCVYDVFYGTDYHSHLGTKRAGLVFYNETEGFRRSIHSLEDGYFRSKFESDLKDFNGKSGIGIISDTDPQPILILNSHMGRFAITSVSRIVNIDELESYFLYKRKHFTENFQGNVNPTEVVANLICEEEDYVSGIEHAHEKVKGFLHPADPDPGQDHSPRGTNWAEPLRSLEKRTGPMP